MLFYLYLVVNWITMTRKSGKTLTHDIWKHWTAVSTLSGQIGSVYRDLHNWKSNQRPKATTEPKLNNWANSPYRTQVTQN